jgi:hypothetical protein
MEKRAMEARCADVPETLWRQVELLEFTESSSAKPRHF